ncbi:hypothetical protein [Ensifer sp. 22460]|uniref:hypothetical protein n=1 Tax=Ensifer sp. 22460 TaxID=3453922 RepID=UPI003F868416
MAGFDGRAFGAEVVEIVKSYLERNLSPVAARIDALEARLRLLEAQVPAKEKAKPVVRLAAPTRIAER